MINTGQDHAPETYKLLQLKQLCLPLCMTSNPTPPSKIYSLRAGLSNPSSSNILHVQSNHSPVTSASPALPILSLASQILRHLLLLTIRRNVFLRLGIDHVDVELEAQRAFDFGGDSGTDDCDLFLRRNCCIGRHFGILASECCCQRSGESLASGDIDTGRRVRRLVQDRRLQTGSGSREDQFMCGLQEVRDGTQEGHFDMRMP